MQRNQGVGGPMLGFPCRALQRLQVFVERMDHRFRDAGAGRASRAQLAHHLASRLPSRVDRLRMGGLEAITQPLDPRLQRSDGLEAGLGGGELAGNAAELFFDLRECLVVRFGRSRLVEPFGQQAHLRLEIPAGALDGEVAAHRRDLVGQRIEIRRAIGTIAGLLEPVDQGGQARLDRRRRGGRRRTGGEFVQATDHRLQSLDGPTIGSGVGEAFDLVREFGEPLVQPVGIVERRATTIEIGDALPEFSDATLERPQFLVGSGPGGDGAQFVDEGGHVIGGDRAAGDVLDRIELVADRLQALVESTYGIGRVDALELGLELRDTPLDVDGRRVLLACGDAIDLLGEFAEGALDGGELGHLRHGAQQVVDLGNLGVDLGADARRGETALEIVETIDDVAVADLDRLQRPFHVRLQNDVAKAADLRHQGLERIEARMARGEFVELARQTTDLFRNVGAHGGATLDQLAQPTNFGHQLRRSALAVGGAHKVELLSEFPEVTVEFGGDPRRGTPAIELALTIADLGNDAVEITHGRTRAAFAGPFPSGRALVGEAADAPIQPVEGGQYLGEAFLLAIVGGSGGGPTGRARLFGGPIETFHGRGDLVQHAGRAVVATDRFAALTTTTGNGLVIGIVAAEAAQTIGKTIELAVDVGDGFIAITTAPARHTLPRGARDGLLGHGANEFADGQAGSARRGDHAFSGFVVDPPAAPRHLVPPPA